jgi:hypothetical protein
VKLPLPENEDSRLESLRSFRILGTSCEQEFDDIARLAATMCDAPVAVIAFIDEQRVWFKAKVGLELDEIPRERVSNPPSQGAEPVLKCGYGSSDERSHGKTTDTGRDSADCGGVCDERHATE